MKRKSSRWSHQPKPLTKTKDNVSTVARRQIIKEYTPSIERIHAIHSSFDFEINGPYMSVRSCRIGILGANISLGRPFFSLMTIHLFVGHLPLAWTSLSSTQVILCFLGVFIPCKAVSIYPLVFYQPRCSYFPSQTYAGKTTAK